jgi:hypothetical protein
MTLRAFLLTTVALALSALASCTQRSEPAKSARTVTESEAPRPADAPDVPATPASTPAPSPAVRRSSPFEPPPGLVLVSQNGKAARLEPSMNAASVVFRNYGNLSWEGLGGWGRRFAAPRFDSR